MCQDGLWLLLKQPCFINGERIMQVYRKQKGQSIAEFVIASGVMGMLMIAIPMMSKIATVKLKSEQAADYVAWRVNKGININDGSELSREVGQRFFSRTGADVLSDQNADCDDAADQDMQGNSLVNWDSIQVNNWVQAEKYSKTLGTDPLKTASKPFYSLSNNGQYRVNVAVPVTSITGISSFPKSFTITGSSGTLRNTWAASNPNEIKNLVKKSDYLKPYETIQVNLNQIYNVAVASMGFEKKIKVDGIYTMDTIPTDRQTTIK